MERKPLITMLEDIRCWAMQRLWMQKQNGLSWDLDICPSIRREIEDLKELQRFWVPYVSGYKEFEVFSGNERYVVDLNQRACGCRSWQLTGIPCVHAISAISSLNLDVEAFVSNSYTKASFLSSYEYNIHPLNDNSEWPHVEGLHTILPPLKRRLPGRPCVKRKRDQAERELSGHTRHTVSRADIPLRCTICHQIVHNKATCPSKPTPAPTTACPSHSTPDSSTSGPSHVKNAPVKKAPVKKAPMKKVLVKKGPVKRSPMKKVPLNDAGRVRKFSERITEIGIQKNVKVKEGTGCSQDKPVTLE
uniref:SWIM-type domain-containing protein n=1 Tax=Lactuca sativa TaxID=4236 RepID=A0A9R1UVU7_LACSA|nr:hypothetical protein LSAT_V11C800405990 [Lactuca sativa]